MTIEQFFSGKRVLITGGTGSFGQKILERLLKTDVSRVYIFSRDEKKQWDMRQAYASSRVQFIVGDVRDYPRVEEAMMGKAIDVVYHAAALKQVPQCEEHPFEAVKTNIIGAQNVKLAAIRAGVRLVVAISTDKAVKPVNAMGMTKALQERIFLSEHNSTRFVCVRYGNVLGSRGSVVPFFHSQLKAGAPLSITDPAMTRFMLTLDQAIDLVFFATLSHEGNVVYVRKMPAANIVELAEVMIEEAGESPSTYPIHFVGIRPGEKVHEILVSEEEMLRSAEFADYFCIFPFGCYCSNKHGEYASDLTHRMSKDEIRDMLKGDRQL